MKADTKAIQAIHENVITHNHRVTVSHSDLNTWNLHIKSVTEDDRGGYMCQLNTDPMKSQVSLLHCKQYKRSCVQKVFVKFLEVVYDDVALNDAGVHHHEAGTALYHTCVCVCMWVLYALVPVGINIIELA